MYLDGLCFWVMITSRSKNLGRNDDHRRDWVESQLLILSGVFAIDVAAYAVMSNLLHLVLNVDIYESNSWTEREVVDETGRIIRDDKRGAVSSNAKEDSGQVKYSQ